MSESWILVSNGHFGRIRWMRYVRWSWGACKEGIHGKHHEIWSLADFAVIFCIILFHPGDNSGSPFSSSNWFFWWDLYVVLVDTCGIALLIVPIFTQVDDEDSGDDSHENDGTVLVLAPCFYKPTTVLQKLLAARFWRSLLLQCMETWSFCWVPLWHWDCHKMMWLSAVWCDLSPVLVECIFWIFFDVLWMNVQNWITLPETNIAPENSHLGDYFLFWKAYSQGLC